MTTPYYCLLTDNIFWMCHLQMNYILLMLTKSWHYLEETLKIDWFFVDYLMKYWCIIYFLNMSPFRNEHRVLVHQTLTNVAYLIFPLPDPDPFLTFSDFAFLAWWYNLFFYWVTSLTPLALIKVQISYQHCILQGVSRLVSQLCFAYFSVIVGYYEMSL